MFAQRRNPGDGVNELYLATAMFGRAVGQHPDPSYGLQQPKLLFFIVRDAAAS
jgi:hypothetical protein